MVDLFLYEVEERQMGNLGERKKHDGQGEWECVTQWKGFIVSEGSTRSGEGL